ncbi:MAG: DUF362 domain-containing protein [Candidatus Omnitrophica bacterium]|nr:DUF362 domain-containing protein [Candidatus Omnitrophota bacterium]MCM8828563.1 DUF362 domain-containing protein [Candidatus Omnitrophota bacterium]
MPEKIAIVRCPDYSRNTVRKAIEKVFELLNPDFSSEVLLKPNMLSARGPDQAVTTHPAIIEALSEMLPKPVYIGDSPPNTQKSIEHYWETCGYKNASLKTDATLVRIEGQSTVFNLNVSGRNVSFPVSEFALKKPVFNLPKFKTHNITVLTCAMKNIYGLIPGYPKGLLHTKFPEPEMFNRFIVELYRLLQDRIIFNIVDAVEIMDGNGPASGRKRRYGYLIAGKNAVCVDLVCAACAGLKISQIPFLRIYTGAYEIPEIKVVGDSPEVMKDFQAPLSSFIFRMQNSGMFSKALRNLASQLNIIPVINHSLCRKCMECYNICPAKAISKDLKIDRKKCINCLCCFEVCPHRAITVRKSFLARMILP